MIRFALALLLAVTIPAVSAQSFSTLEEQMTAKQFRDAGLDKLSPEELAALNEWLGDKGLGQASEAQVDRRGLRDNGLFGSLDDKPFSAHLVGTFRGWDGETVFELDNGQVWQQAESGRGLGGVELESPAVKIRPGFANGWTLQVEGYNSRVKVKRIR